MKNKLFSFFLKGAFASIIIIATATLSFSQPYNTGYKFNSPGNDISAAGNYAAGQSTYAYSPDDRTNPDSPYYNRDEEGHLDGCTAMLVGRKASTDGSVMTSHSCDSNYRTWVTMEPEKTAKPGETDEIKWGLLHTEEPYDMRGVTVKGSIPAVEHTYSYLNTAYPCMNEKQLAMGESTTDGKEELVNHNGLFLIEELERIALQRCDNARDAIRLMGSLAEQYGFGDWGECLTVIDKNEAWQFEIYGTGKSGKKPGALWVAERVPDDEVAINGNVPRIGVVDFNNPDKFMYAKDIKERTKELKLWDGKSPFKFYPMVTTYKKNFMWREYFVLNKLAPSLGLKYTDEEMPFSVKPEKKVSPEMMFSFYRETYDGTDFDQVKYLKIPVERKKMVEGKEVKYTDSICPVSTFMPSNMRTLLNQLKPGCAPRIRTIAAIQCSYSHVIRLRNWLPDAVGGVAYFAFDNPAESPRIPIYAGETKLPKGFDICGQKRYRTDSAIWSFRETNRIATINWDATKEIVRNKAAQYEKKMMDETPELEKRAEQLIKAGREDEAIKLLEDYTQEITASEERSWQDMKADLWTIFARAL